MDQKLFLLFSSFSGRSFWLDKIIYFWAVVWPWLAVLMIIFWLFLQPKRSVIFKGAIVFFLASLIWWLTSLFKYVYFSPRPFMELFVNKPLFTMTVWWDSLPSGHAVFFSALAGSSLLFKEKSVTIFLLVTAILVSVARVVAGVHWPSDIVFGLAFGGMSGYLFYLIFNKIFFKA